MVVDVVRLTPLISSSRLRAASSLAALRALRFFWAAVLAHVAGAPEPTAMAMPFSQSTHATWPGSVQRESTLPCPSAGIGSTSAGSSNSQFAFMSHSAGGWRNPARSVPAAVRAGKRRRPLPGGRMAACGGVVPVC